MNKKSNRKSNILIGLGALFFIVVINMGFQIVNSLDEFKKGRPVYKYTEGLESEFFPCDEGQSKLIEESAPINSGETWAIYMYLNASNLELSGHSQLSEFVEKMAKEESDERIEAEKQYSKQLLSDFIATGEENNIHMPISFYDADYEKGAKADIPEEKHEVSNQAWGSDILNTIRKAQLPDNVTFVVQPAGAKAWKDVQVNPNRTRRFVKQGSELVEVYDAPVTNMGKSETLSDFLTFCREEYPADHTMVILTDHGGGMTGFGWDNVYNDDNLTLRELTEAFDNAYGIDENDAPIDLLYYNACLMSNTDVINSMRGVCKYMIAGEEVGLSVFEYYADWAGKISDNPNMNAMQLGKALIDCYAAELVKNGAILGAPQSTGLGLLDMQKAPKVYDAYADFARKVLMDVADNPRILASLSRAVSESISFAEESYKRYNLTDLGLWVSNIDDMYPDESKEIVELIDESVIYKRFDNYLTDAQGISVYFPNYIEDLPSLKVALKYIDSISYSEDISALYYYKLAGCLDEKYRDYCSEARIKIPEPIDYGAMSVLRKSEITATDDCGNVKATIDEAVYPILTDVRYELGKVSGDTVTYYGEDRFVAADGDNGIQTVFEGKWVNIDDVPFYVRVINTYDNVFIYESPVKYRDYEYRLILRCEVKAENGEDKFTILGLRHPNDEAATIDRNVEVLNPGSYVIPIYYQSAVNGEAMEKTEGISVLYNINSKIQDKKLDKGKYRVRIVYENMRGEDVYSAPVFFEVK